MKKILIIEDNEEVRDNTSEILELSNYKVFTAEDGRAGVKLALQEKPDLIICDIMMPEIDGFGVLHLLGKHESTVGIPFIFLTAKAEKTDLRKGMEAGADDYLTKPFDGTELLNAVKARLQKADMLKRNYAPSQTELEEFIRKAAMSGNVQLTSDEREVVKYKRKHILYSEGQRPKFVYYIIKGKVKTFKTNEEGKELITKIYGPNDFFGFASIIEEVNQQDSAHVLEEASIMLIPREDFVELITKDANISSSFIKIISHSILEKEKNLLNFAYNSLRKKVAYGLVHLFEEGQQGSQSSSPALDLTRKNLAHLIGVATESLIRTLSEFKEEKLIDFDERKVVLLNKKRLKELRN